MRDNKKLIIISIILLIFISYICGISKAASSNMTIYTGYGYTTLTLGGSVTICAEALKDTSVFCAQHGVNIKDGASYKVSSQEYTVQDPVLAYILAEGAVDGNSLYDPTQVALWKYLYENKNDYSNEDLNNIYGNNTSDRQNLKNVSSSDTGLTQSLYNAGILLYNYAKNNSGNMSGARIEISNIIQEGNNVIFKVSGKYDEFKLYVNGEEYGTYTSNGRNITIDVSNIEEETITIKAIAYVKLYEVKYVVLAGTTVTQRLIVVTDIGHSSAVETNISDEEEVILNTDISLQKYIIGVNNSQGNEGIDTLGTARQNKYAVNQNKTLFSTGNYNHKDKNISNFKDETIVNTSNIEGYETSIKRDAPVEIEAGDKVTYKISVYNNSDINASSVKVRDDISPNIGEITEIKAKIGGGLYSEATLIKNLDIIRKDENGYTELEFSLDKRQKVDIYVTIRYYECTSDLVRNRAYIYDTTPSNKKENRTIDGDYIKMANDYAVSLEKYISKADENTADGRINHPIYNQNGYSKENNPVEVEIGDIIIYTLKLTNTTESNRSIKVKEVVDRFNADELEFQEILEGSYGYGENCYSINQFNNTKELYINTVNPIEIAKGSSEYIYLKFRVIGDKELIENSATVTKINNRNNVEVTDIDGIENNTDKDWIKVKKYEVSLEKYVSAINGKDIASREGLAEYLTLVGNIYVDNTKNDTQWTWHNDIKYKNPVTVESGNEVTYTIKVNNDGVTKVTIKDIKDTLPNSGILRYRVGTDGKYVTDLKNREVKINTQNITLNPGESTTVQITVQVNEPNTSLEILKNNARVEGFINKNNIDVEDLTPYNNEDNDYIQLDYGYDIYTSVSVEKIWEHNNNTNIPKQITVQLYRNGVATGSEVSLSLDNNWRYVWNNLDKYDSNENEYIYTVREINIPEGYIASYSGNENKIIITNINTITPPTEYISKTVEKKWLYDENGKDRPVEITVQLYKNGIVEGAAILLNATNNWKYTWNNLEKYDYEENENIYTVQEINIPEHYKVEYDLSGDTFIINNKYDAPDSPDVIIGGYVWNDIPLDKQQNDYNAQIDEQEHKLEGIKVYLYRDGIESPIAISYTNSEGYYGFSNSDIDKSVVPEAHKQYIKAEKIEGTQRWNKDKYYSYYVVFEYDGITYTSTPDGTSMEDIIASSKDYKIDSNAKEDNGKVNKARRDFNNSIDPNSGIEYNTVNEEGYIPESKYIYNSEKMTIQSSTNKISFETLLSGKDYNKVEDLRIINEIEDKLKYVGLGLRGRDIFDLELTSDVAKVEVTVNNQKGIYEYTNKVTVRRNDLSSNYSYGEDMANPYTQGSEYVGEEQQQAIRKTDIVNNAYDENQLLQKIQVTYKITVKNTSKTDGTATKITNYYDSNYTFIEAKDSGGNTLTTTNGVHGEGYNSRVITTSGTNLKQNEKIEIYVVYTLNNPKTLLAGLIDNQVFATFNMAEITEYTTKCAQGQTEYTRGLIDKDSAPGNANSDKVSLEPNAFGSESTVQYYFGRNDLSVLKYEDDTYATPTLYFVSPSDEDDNGDGIPDYSRTIKGTVFEDLTKINRNNVKSGNGIKDGEDPTICGITVELIEIDTVRYTTTTDQYGNYTFTDFLPGNYTIKYYYGDTEKTFLKNYDNNGNEESYNGEDFQSTNNSYDVEEITVKKLSKTPNYWYLENEAQGISTATDNISRRNTVSTNVINFTDEEMTELNSARLGEQLTGIGNKDDDNSLIGRTYMYSYTPSMTLNMEKTNNPEQNVQFRDYKVSNMNFGIAEVPVTTIDLQKSVKSFVITDSTEKNIIAKVEKNEDEWKVNGDIYVLDSALDVSIEDEKLQGAKLQVTYEIVSSVNVEKNFDNTSPTVATIAGIADYIDNNLSYNPNLGENSKYWEITTYDELKAIFGSNQYQGGTIPQGVLDPEGNQYNVVVKATSENPLLKGEEKVSITLERVLASSDSTLEQIITSTVETFTYNNTVEITKFNYGNTAVDSSDETEDPSDPENNGGNGEPDNNGVPEINGDNRVQEGQFVPGYIISPGDDENENLIIQRDRIRTKGRFIIIPGVQYDTAAAQTIIIHPPTGASGISTIYYILVAIALAVISVGIFGIKKFVTKK